MFDHLDAQQSALGIASYAVSMTTLEEVFLRLEHDEHADTADGTTLKLDAKTAGLDAPGGHDAPGGLDARRREHAPSLATVKTRTYRPRPPTVIPRIPSDHCAVPFLPPFCAVPGRPSWRVQFEAVLRARVAQLARSPRRYVFSVIVPTLFMLIGVIIYSSIPTASTSQVRCAHSQAIRPSACVRACDACLTWS